MRRRDAALGAIAATLVCSAWVRIADAVPVIPPGRESQLLEIFGRGQTFPNGCRLAAVSVDHGIAHARYRCSDRQRAVELSWPSARAPLRTARFAVTFEPHDAPEFEQSVLRHVRDREPSWVWVQSAFARRSARHLSLPLRAPLESAAAILVALLAVATLAWLLHLLRTQSLAPPPAPRRTELAIPAFAAIVAFALLRVVTPLPPAHSDTARDLLFAHECMQRGCTSGPPSSAPMFLQGTLWPRALALLLRAHLGTHGIQTLLLASEVLGALALAWSWRRHVNPRGAWIAAALGLMLAHRVAEPPVVWGPSMLPVCLLLAAAALPATAHLGRIRDAALLGIALAGAAESHVACAPMLPAAVLVLLAAGTPLLAVLASAAPIAILPCISRATWQNNLSLVPLRVAAPVIVAMLALAWVVRRRARLLEPADRVRFAILLWAPACLAGPLVLAGRVPIRESPRYVGPAVVAACLFAGVIVAVIAERWKSLMRGRLPMVLEAAAVAATLSLTPLARVRPRWTYPDVERVWSVLHSRGASYASLRRSLARDWELLDALGPLDPRLGIVPRPASSNIVVLRAARSLRPPRSTTVVPLTTGDVAWILEVRERFERDSASLCMENRGSAPVCVALPEEPTEETSLVDRAYVARAELHAIWTPFVTAETLRFRVTVRRDDDPVPWRAVLLEPGWEFVDRAGARDRPVGRQPPETLEAVRSRARFHFISHAWPPPLVGIPEDAWTTGVAAAVAIPAARPGPPPAPRLEPEEP